MKTLTADLKTISVDKVDPARWSLKEDPVTREDLGRDFRPVVQCGADPRSLALHIDRYHLGDAITCGFSLKTKEDWLEAIRRGYFLASIVGEPAQATYTEKTDPKTAEEMNQWLMKHAGRLYGGFLLGEQEGRYLSSTAKKFRKKKETESFLDYYCWQHTQFGKREHRFKKHQMKNFFQNRSEAYLDFRNWMALYEERSQHYLSPMAHTNYIHYLAELNEARILGAELALIMSNHQVFFAYMRGASRQYGLLFWTITSVWSRWGLSAAAAPGQTHTGITEIGLYKGTPVELARRIWYLGYMYGASMLAGEFGYFELGQWDYMSGKTDTPPALSELGKLQVTASEWAKKHPQRGVPYNPVALMLDFYNGWLPPKHGYQYTGEKRLVWGALPYERGDHQIDNFFRWVFPGYEEGSYHRDGQGTFVATPFGDIFDVLLSNADPGVLKRYNAIILLGEDIKVTDVLKKYVHDGGDLVVGVNNMEAHDERFYGVKRTGRVLQGNESRSGEKKFIEEPYTCHEIILAGAEVLLESGNGQPLVTVHGYGKGRVIALAADCWMSDLKPEGERKEGIASQRVKDRSPDKKFPDWDAFARERNLDCPYNCAIRKMILDGKTLGEIESQVCVHCRVECTNEVARQCDILEGVKAVLGDYFGTFMPFKIQGPPVHYLMNVGKDQKRVVVTLVNHEKVPWEGSVCFNDSDRQTVKIREWIEDIDGDLARITIGPEGIKIFEITADRNIFSPSH